MKSESSSVFLRLAKIIPLSSLSARLNNFQTLKVRLSNHATFAALQCDVKDFPTSDWFNLFSSIKEKDLYNYIHLNHNSFPLNECHGPYNFSNLNNNSFNLIDGEFFYKAIEDILKKDHWLQPPIDNSKVSIQAAYIFSISGDFSTWIATQSPGFKPKSTKVLAILRLFAKKFL